VTTAQLDKPTSAPLDVIRRTLARHTNAVTALLAGYMSPERFMGSIVTLVRHNPDLQKCHPESILLAALRIAQLRLSPDPSVGQAWLIPRSKKVGPDQWVDWAEFQLGYKGVLQLAYRSPLVRDVRYGVVGPGDHFVWRDGREWVLEHVPTAAGWPTKMEDIVAAWAIVELVNGGAVPRVMYRQELLNHKARGQGKQPAWGTDPAPMSAKTVLGDACRRGPIDTESAIGINLDHEGEVGLGQYTGDLEEAVRPEAAAAGAAATILASQAARTVTPTPPAAPALPEPTGGTMEAPREREAVPAAAAPAAAPQQQQAQTPAPAAGRKEGSKPHQAAIDMLHELGVPRVGEGVAMQLHSLNITTPEQILEVGAGWLEEKVNRLGKLTAQALVIAAEKKLNPEPERPVEGGASSSETVAGAPPLPAADDPFAGMDVQPVGGDPLDNPFDGQKAGPPSRASEPPPPEWIATPIKPNEALAIERQAMRTKRNGAPAGPDGDKAAIDRLNAFVAHDFDTTLDHLPRGAYSAVFEWAAMPGLDPEPASLATLRRIGKAKPRQQ
jgi:recombination protein RecT